MAKEVLELEIKSNISGISKDTEAIIAAIKEAKEETKELDKGLEDVGKSSSKSVGGVKKLASAFGGLMKSLGIVALVAAAFTAMKEALERNQKVMNVVNTIMSAVSITFNQVVGVLTDTYEWVTKSSDRFDGLGKVLKGLMTIALTPLKAAFYGLKLGVQEVQLAWEKWMGGADPEKMAELRAGIVETRDALEEIAVAAVDAGKDIGKNIGDAIGEIGAIGKVAIDGISEISIKSNIELAKATTDAANSSKLAEAAIQGLIEKYDRQAELQRQIRDDETKTFAERIEANKKLGEILDEQEQEMLALADTRVASAALELSANKENIELQVAYQQALNDRAGVEAQVAGFRSEQMTNEVSLNKELIEIKKELGLAGLEGIDLELAELKTSYEMKLEMARKSGEDITAITAEYEAQQTEIIEAEAEKQKEIDQQVAAAKVDALKQGLEVIQSFMDVQAQQTENDYQAELEMAEGNADAIEGIEEKYDGIRREEAKKHQKMQIAMALVDTYQSAVSAYANAIKIPYVGLAMAPISAGLAVLAGLANVAMISKQPLGGGGGGGGGAPPATAQPPAPQMMSGAFELTGGEEVEPTRAYVVSDDITASQNGLEVIRRRATI